MGYDSVELTWMKGYKVSMDKNVRWQIQKRRWTGRVVFYDNVKIKSNEKHFFYMDEWWKMIQDYVEDGIGMERLKKRLDMEQYKKPYK